MVWDGPDVREKIGTFCVIYTKTFCEIYTKQDTDKRRIYQVGVITRTQGDTYRCIFIQVKNLPLPFHREDCDIQKPLRGFCHGQSESITDTQKCFHVVKQHLMYDKRSIGRESFLLNHRQFSTNPYHIFVSLLPTTERKEKRSFIT